MLKIGKLELKNTRLKVNNMDYLNQLKEAYQGMRQSPDHGASNNEVEYTLTLEDLAWGYKAAILELNNDDPVLCERIKTYTNEEILQEANAEEIDKQIDEVYKKIAKARQKSTADLAKELEKFKFHKQPEALIKHKDKTDYKKYYKQIEDLKKQRNRASNREFALQTAGALLTVAAVTAIGYGVYKAISKARGKKAAALAAANKSKQLAKKAKSQGRDKAAAQASKNAKNWESRAKKYKAKDQLKEAHQLEYTLTLEDLAWGARAVLIEMNYDDPVLCENIKTKSNDEVLNIVFEVKLKPLDLRIDKDKLTMKSQTKAMNKRVDNLLNTKIDGGHKTSDDIKMYAGMAAGITLTVAAVSAIAYGVYKIVSGKRGKKAAAYAAAQKSKQLANQAKAQGRDKAAAKASENARKWEAKAKSTS
jgi:hypothetical protein